MKKVVLMVDDAKQALAPLSRALDAAGYDVKTGDATSAIDAFGTVPPELIFIQLAAGGGTAVTLAEQIRQRPDGALVPILFVGSGQEMITSVSDALAVGGDYYFQHPLDLEKVQAKVRAYIGVSAQLHDDEVTRPDGLVEEWSDFDFNLAGDKDKRAIVEDHLRSERESAQRLEAEPPPPPNADAIRKQVERHQAETKRKADEQQQKAEEQALRDAQARAQRQAETLAKQHEAALAELEKKRKAEDDAQRIAAEDDMRRKIEDELRAQADQEAKKKAEAERLRVQRLEEETRRRVEGELREETRKKTEEDQRRKADEDARKKAEEDSRRQFDEERRRLDEERRRMEEEFRRADEDRKKLEEEARKREEESRKRIEEETRRRLEDERRALDEAQKRAENDARRRVEEEQKRMRAEADALRRQGEEQQKRIEDEVRLRLEQELKRKAGVLDLPQPVSDPGLDNLRVQPPQALSGQISERHIGGVLGRLTMERITGKVVFAKTGSEKVIAFERGAPVAAASSDPSDRFEEFLLREHLLTRQQYQICRMRQLGGPRQTGAFIVNEGFLKPEELFDAVRRHLEDCVQSLFEWEEGNWSYRPELASADDRVVLTTPGERLILDGVRRRYLLARMIKLIGTPASLLVPLGELPAERLGLDGKERGIYKLLDGTRSLEDLVFSSGMSEERVYQLFCGLEALGYVQVAVRGAEAEQAEGGDNIDRARITERYELAKKADYFEFLGLSETATEYEIERALAAMRKLFGKERFATGVANTLSLELAEIERVLGDAEYVLRDARLRETYLQHLGRRVAAGGLIGRD